MRHLTVQSVLGALDLGYSTRRSLSGLERRLGANSEFSAEGELTVYKIMYIFCTQFILFTIRWLRSITLLVLRPNHVNQLLQLFNGFSIGFLRIRYGIGIGSIQPVRLMVKFPKIHFGIRRLIRKHFVLSNILWRIRYLSQIRLNLATGSSLSLCGLGRRFPVNCLITICNSFICFCPKTGTLPLCL